MLALVFWGLYSAIRSSDAFVVKIVSGVPRVTRGTVTRAFVAEIGEVCRRHGVRDGAVRGVVKNNRIKLEFSRGITAPCQQQLRNLWSLSGWSA
jgi:hypothetical protein